MYGLTGRLLLMLCGYTSLSASAQPFPPEFNHLVSLIPGYFDNKLQVDDEIRRHVPEDKRHLQLSMTLRVEDTLQCLPGKETFYIEQWLGGNYSNIIRQRIYSFGIDPVTTAIQNKIYELKNASKFLHAVANDPLFADVTLDDLIYKEGCDVFWYQVNGTEMFTSWMMRNSCHGKIDGLDVVFMDSNNLTSNYLTAYEQWLLSNGTDILHEPSPYNMTKINTEGPRDLADSTNQQAAANSTSPSTVTNVIADFKLLLEALFSGYPVHYRADLRKCAKGMTTGTVSPPEEIVSLVDAFEFFNDTRRFFMEPHVGFSSFSSIVDFTGVEAELTEVRVYTTGRVSVDLSFLSGDLRHLVGKVSYNCTMSTEQPAASVTFMKENVTVSSVVTFEGLRDTLINGKRVLSVSDYGRCSINATAVGGGVITDVKLYSDRITSSAVKTITNYQGPGFVYDIVTTTYWSNGSVISIASDRDVVTFKSYYVEQIDCGIIGGGSVHFYQLLN